MRRNGYSKLLLSTALANLEKAFRTRINWERILVVIKERQKEKGQRNHGQAKRRNPEEQVIKSPKTLLQIQRVRNVNVLRGLVVAREEEVHAEVVGEVQGR
jgi:hypothetical protein